MKILYGDWGHIERAVLGCFLKENTSWHEVSDLIQDTDFAHMFHREVFQAICVLIKEGKTADVMCVSEFMFNKGKKSDDPFASVCELLNGLFTVDNIKIYVRILRNNSVDRQLLIFSEEIKKLVQESKDDRLDLITKRIHSIAQQTSNENVPIHEILKSVLSSIDDRYQNKLNIIGTPTGFDNLDKITQGLHGGDLIILAGRPSMGKTVLAMNIVEHLAFKGFVTAMFTLEMSKEQLIERSLASIGKVKSELIRSGKLTTLDFENIVNATEKLENTKLFIHDSSFLTVCEIRAICRRHLNEHGLNLIVIDYISLMAGDGENETMRIGSITRALKILARDFNVPIIAISQLNRTLENRNKDDRRPCMADLRQSGAIEQDADMILFVYRDEIYNPDTPNKGIAEIIIAKHRNGPIGTVYLEFKGEYLRFDDYIGNVIDTSKVASRNQRTSFKY